MDQETTKLTHQILQGNNRDELLALFSFKDSHSTELIVLKFNLWVRKYFPKFFSSDDSDAHKEIDTYNTKVFRGDIKTFTNIGFRGLAKTTRTKLFFAFWIANDRDHSRKYLKILSKDLTNSKQSVTDIYNLLIEPTIVEMYPDIFKKTEYKREEKMESFTTATGIKLTAKTVGTDQKGQLQEEARPDVIWFDDFETVKTLRSAVETNAIWLNMDEALQGLAKDGGAIYTCNYTSERGNVHKLVEGKNERNIVMITPIIRDGKPTWPARYTVEEIKHIESEALDYAGDYLCKPSASKDILFSREKIDAMIKREPISTIAGFRKYFKYDASHRYGSGADVAGGVGLDSSTNVIIDFSTMPAQVVAAFDDNEVKPDTFGDELDRQNADFGKPIVGVENNKFDMAIGRLKQIYPLDRIYKTQPPEDKVDSNGRKPLPTYGWGTNALTKPKMIFGLAKAVNDGLLELCDKRLIAEARSYTRNDLMDTEVDVRLTTRHFDLLVAAAIAWQMKDFATVAQQKDTDISHLYTGEPMFSDIGI